MSAGVTTVLKLRSISSVGRGALYQHLPVRLCNNSTFVAFSTNNHDSLVFILVHIGKRRMTLHEHAGVHIYIQLLAQIGHTLRLMLATAIREEDKGNALRLEIGEGPVGTRQRVGASKEDSIDTDGRQR